MRDYLLDAKLPRVPVHCSWLADIALAFTLAPDDVAPLTCSVNTAGPALPHPLVAVTLIAVVPVLAVPLRTPVDASNEAQLGKPVALQVMVGSPVAVNVNA